MYAIHCKASGDFAEASDLASALLAARTLVADHTEASGRQGATKAARCSLIVVRDGMFDGLATTLAQAGEARAEVALALRNDTPKEEHDV